MAGENVNFKLSDYQQTFPETPPGGLTWNLTPVQGGLRAAIRF